MFKLYKLLIISIAALVPMTASAHDIELRKDSHTMSYDVTVSDVVLPNQALYSITLTAHKMIDNQVSVASLEKQNLKLLNDSVKKIKVIVGKKPISFSVTPSRNVSSNRMIYNTYEIDMVIDASKVSRVYDLSMALNKNSNLSSSDNYRFFISDELREEIKHKHENKLFSMTVAHIKELYGLGDTKWKIKTISLSSVILSPDEDDYRQKFEFSSAMGAPVTNKMAYAVAPPVVKAGTLYLKTTGNVVLYSLTSSP